MMIMWNSEALLKLLDQMPARLNEANLDRIQQTIDIDKYINSAEQGRDLCGDYAPFCALCDKTVTCPCAVAYVKMRQQEGAFIEIATEVAAEEAPAAADAEAAPTEEAAESAPEAQEVVVEVANVEGEPATEETSAESEAAPVADAAAEPAAEPVPEEKPKKKATRIATARRKKATK